MILYNRWSLHLPGGKKPPPQFIERVRHVRYPQFFWDKLPIGGPSESLLRFDHLQPIGWNSESFETTGYRLCDQAVEILDDVFNFYLLDRVRKDCDLKDFLDLMDEFFDYRPV